MEQIFDPNITRFPQGLARLLVLEAMHRGRVRYEHIGIPEERNLRKGRPTADEAAALDVLGAESWYDANYITIPYRRFWNAPRITKMIKGYVRKLLFLCVNCIWHIFHLI